MQKIAIFITLFFLSILVFAQVSYQEFFNSWDMNRDGRVVMQEFPGNPVYFSEIDNNKDGMITLEELRLFLEGEFTASPTMPPNPPTPPQHTMADHRACEQKLASVQNELARTQSELKQVSSNAQNMRAEMQQQAGNFRSELGKRDEMIRDLEMKLRNAQNQGNSAQVVQLQQQLSNYQAELAKRDQVLQTKENVIRDLEARLRNASNTSNNSAQINQMLQVIEQLKRDVQARDQNIQAQNKRIQELEAKLKGSTPTKPTQKDMMDEKNIPLLGNLLSAREYARVDAYDMLAKQISGHWIAASSKNVDGENQLKIISKVPPTALFMVDVVDDGSDTANGLVRLKAIIKRENAIESIRKTKEMSGQKFSFEDFQELRMMLPEVITSFGYGAYKAPAQKMLLAAQGARLDAKRKLIEKLRGVTVQGSTRLENFVVQEHEVSVTIQNTWLLGVQIAKEEVIDKVMVQSTVEISRANFIYSIRLGLEKIGQKMTPDEYQNLRNMLPDESYKMAGEAAIE